MIKNFILITAVFLICSCDNHNDSEKPAIVSGEQLFKIKCAQCHKPAEDFTGPALRNVTGRWNDKELLYEFIKQPQTVIERGGYAKDLFIKWKQAYMQPFPDLSNQEINRILNYCDSVQ